MSLKFYRKMLFVGAMLIISMALRYPVTAQDNLLKPVYEAPDRLYSDLTWSYDSRTLALSHDQLLYDVQSSTLTLQQMAYINVLTLQQSDIQRFGLESFVDLQGLVVTGKTFISFSPNQRYLIYESPSFPVPESGEGVFAESYLTIADRETGNLSVLKTIVIQGSTFDVHWSTYSAAFTLTQLGAYDASLVTDYVNNFQRNVMNAQTKNMQITIKRSLYNAEGYSLSTPIYDLSDDGQAVLIRATATTEAVGLPPAFVLIWHPDDENANLTVADIDGRKVMAASFVYGDPGKVILVTERGLALYNIQTQQVHLIDIAINSRWLSAAAFSPDGKWLAMIDTIDANITEFANRPKGNKLYIVNVSSLITN